MRIVLNNLASDPGEILRALFNNLQSQNKHFQFPDMKIVNYFLGKGGMGEVYQAKHKVTGGLKAVKVLLSKVAVNAEAKKSSFEKFKPFLHFTTRILLILLNLIKWKCFLYNHGIL